MKEENKLDGAFLTAGTTPKINVEIKPNIVFKTTLKIGDSTIPVTTELDLEGIDSSKHGFILEVAASLYYQDKVVK